MPDHCKKVNAVVCEDQILIAISNMQALPAKDANQIDYSTSNETNVNQICSVGSILSVFLLVNMCD